MSNIIWIILIGFIAGLIARMLSPGLTIPRVSSLPPYLASQARLSRRSSARLSAGIGSTRAPVSSARLSER